VKPVIEKNGPIFQPGACTTSRGPNKRQLRINYISVLRSYVGIQVFGLTPIMFLYNIYIYTYRRKVSFISFVVKFSRITDYSGGLETVVRRFIEIMWNSAPQVDCLCRIKESDFKHFFFYAPRVPKLNIFFEMNTFI